MFPVLTYMFGDQSSVQIVADAIRDAKEELTYTLNLGSNS